MCIASSFTLSKYLQQQSQGIFLSKEVNPQGDSVKKQEIQKQLNIGKQRQVAMILQDCKKAIQEKQSTDQTYTREFSNGSGVSFYFIFNFLFILHTNHSSSSFPSSHPHLPKPTHIIFLERVKLNIWNVKLNAEILRRREQEVTKQKNPSKGSKIIMEEWQKDCKSQRQQVTVFSSHSRTVIYVNSQQLGQHTHDLQKLKTDKIPGWMNEKNTKSHLS